MKIAVVGCGAVGSYYGARLCQAGHEVHFLLRSDYDMVRSRGLRVFSPAGDWLVRPCCARSPEDIGPAEVVLIALKTTANAEVPRLAGPLRGEGTLLVTLQNGLGNEESLAAAFGPGQILGGLCFVCLNRIEPGLILHTAHGRIVLGEYQRGVLDRTRALGEVLRKAGVPCDVTDDLAAAHWEKLVWNVPFNGLGVAGCAGYEAVWQGRLLPETPLGACLPTDQLLGDPRWEALVRELMREVICAARARGYALHSGMMEEQIERTRVMQAYKASTLIDFERGQPLETQGMFYEPLRLALEAGAPVPRLANLCRVLQALEAAKMRPK